MINDDADVQIQDVKEPHADLECMLLANLAKSDGITRLLTLKRDVPKQLSTSDVAIDQLLDCFVKGAGGSYNKDASYDYLSYLCADISKHESGRKHLLNPRREDKDIIPFSKIIVFTEQKSAIRRRGVANTIRNVCFDVDAHPKLLASEADGGIGVLPYILLPLMGSESYDDEDTEGMLDECQLLDPDKARDDQNDILCTHVESLLLLATLPEGRATLRTVKVYPIIREVHQHVEDDVVRHACDRLVQVLMRGEPGDSVEQPPKIEETEEDEEEQMVEVA